MELKADYKQTDVGVLPKEWEVKPLRAILCNGRLGGNYPNQNRETAYPLIKMGNIARGYIELSKTEYITPRVTPEPQHRLAKGDVLFNTRNTLDLVGKVAIWRNELPVAYYNSNLMRLEFDERHICSNEYASAALNTSRAIAALRGLATGTTSVAAIYTRDLLDVPFVIPPLPEQRAIAAALSDADALLAALGRLIAKKRDLKQAAMQQLLTGRIRLPGFQAPWETKALGELGTIVTGNTPPPSDASNYGDEFPFVTPADIGEAKSIDRTVKRLSRKGFAISRRLPKNSILFVCIGATIGKCGVAMEELTANQQINAILPSPAISADFLYYSCRAAAPRVRSLAGEQAVPLVNKTQFSGTNIALPSHPEQVAIAAVLGDMDLELAVLESRCEKTRALKQGMMQELLNGRTRLVSPGAT